MAVAFMLLINQAVDSAALDIGNFMVKMRLYYIKIRLESCYDMI